MTLTGQVVRVLAGDRLDIGPLGTYLHSIAVCVDVLRRPELIVADGQNCRVVAFRLDGSAARVVCGEARPRRDNHLPYLDPQAIHPTGLAVTATGELWMVDGAKHCVSLLR